MQAHLSPPGLYQPVPACCCPPCVPSPPRLREIRKNVAITLREQGAKKYDVEEYNKMYGMGMY